MIRIGERLRQEREKKGFSIDEVAKATKIRPQFLRAIEDGTFAKLPSGSYASGFVKNYIEFLGMPVREYMAMFRREFNEKEYTGVLPDSFITKEEIPLKTIRFNRTIAFFALALVIIFSYIFFQYRSAFFPPALSLTTPSDASKISSPTVIVSGTTDTNTTVTVNNLPAFVDTNGHFSKEIPVFPGNAAITVKAVNSFGKVSEVDRHIIVLVGQ